MKDMGKNESLCRGSVTLIFACSGAADVGEIADRAARQLAAEGCGKMFCLAGLGGNVREMIETTAGADRIVAIDGCPTDCAKKTLAEAGFDKVRHIRVTDLDMEKGKTPATPVSVRKVVDKVKEKIKS